MPTVKGRYVRDALPHTFKVGVLKCDKKNFTTIKYIYNESTNFIDSCNDRWNFPYAMLMIGMGSMVTHARLRYMTLLGAENM